MAQAADPEEASFAVKNKVKAGSVLRVMRNDPDADLLKQGFVMSQPMVRSLNRVQKADKLVSNFRHLMNVDPDSEAAKKAKRLSADMNWRFLSGDSGIHPRVYLASRSGGSRPAHTPGNTIGVGRLKGPALIQGPVFFPVQGHTPPTSGYLLMWKMSDYSFFELFLFHRISKS